MDKVVVLSCEHASNKVSDALKKYFDGAENVLNSHRGYDLGAEELYDLFKNDHIAYCQTATASRLVVDINRSLRRRTLYSEYTKALPSILKEQILEQFYYGFRRPFEEKIIALWKAGCCVLHVSVHSFTPVLNDEIRQTDFGILYNPEREKEKEFAKIWKRQLAVVLPEYRTRFNYPYRGKPDGHVRYFRDRETEKYLGIEFEMNQKYANDAAIKESIAKAFKNAIEQWLKIK